MFHQVAIGSNRLQNSKKSESPIIGENVYIGANCIVIKDVSNISKVVVSSPDDILYEILKK